MSKTALITGITGQDGSYLAEFLLEKGYQVYGLFRRGSTNTAERIAHLLEEREKQGDGLHLVYGDMTDSMNLVRLMLEIRPDEVYNLAAQSHVAVSFEEPEYTANADGIGVLRILEAVRVAGLGKTTRIYQASTSELFGKVEEIPQKETTPFHPRSPYAVAKLYGYWITRHYREAYGMYAVNGILFNHESERRGETFVTRKITLAAANIAAGRQERLYLGKPEREAGLGLRQGLRGVHVADASARYAGGLRDRHRRDPDGPGVYEGRLRSCGDPAALRGRGPGGKGNRRGHRARPGGGVAGILPPGGGGSTAGRPVEGPGGPGLESSEDLLRRAGQNHGGARHGAGEGDQHGRRIKVSEE